eukprot:jgi/Tetstr1/456408/TSEL_043142.t1
MEIKEGFRNGSNQQPQHLLKSGKPVGSSMWWPWPFMRSYIASVTAETNASSRTTGRPSTVVDLPHFRQNSEAAG